ncbi:MAG: Lrp/AsnC family transcriptional regulator [Clostridiales bacterium]|nr:Lrp/AsnC family transcriptional regulator [Clostridiales bacterium]MBR3842834.1 Lrp/AsnC family transcriptional regulator [Christensenellaceae bacterium]
MTLKKEIIEILKQDARLSYKTIAGMTGASEAEVEKAIKELEDGGVIIKYLAAINDEKVDNAYAQAMIELKVHPQRDFGYNDIARRVSKFPQVKSVYLVSGAYDLNVMVEAPTMKDISTFVWEKLAVMDGISSTVTLFIMRKYKDNGVILTDIEKEERMVIMP